MSVKINPDGSLTFNVKGKTQPSPSKAPEDEWHELHLVVANEPTVYALQQFFEVMSKAFPRSYAGEAHIGEAGDGMLALNVLVPPPTSRN